MLDFAGIDILYYSVIPHRPSSTDDLMMISEAESVPSTMLMMEQIKSQPKPISEPISTPSILTTISLEVITSLTSLTLIVEPASFEMVTSSTLL